MPQLVVTQHHLCLVLARLCLWRRSNVTHTSKNWTQFSTVINASMEEVISAQEQALISRGKVVGVLLHWLQMILRESVMELKLCIDPHASPDSSCSDATQHARVLAHASPFIQTAVVWTKQNADGFSRNIVLNHAKPPPFTVFIIIIPGLPVMHSLRGSYTQKRKFTAYKFDLCVELTL